MTTSTTTPRVAYTADGSTASYSFNFEIADSSSIAVYEGATKKTLTTHYTISFDSGTSGTGSVVFASAPSDSTVITLIRDTNLARTTDFTQSGAFLADTVNAEFDRLSQAVIDATDKIENQAISTVEPNTDTATLTIPDAATRADKVLSFDSSGNAQVSSGGTGTVSNIATGTGLTGGAITTTGTIAIDSTVATLTGSQSLTNKTLTSPVINTGVSGTAILDEDNFSSNSATQLATQQSIKAYVDSQILTKDNTDEIAEGSSNLYFTNARADARITAALIDEDDMSTNSATRLPSQQSVKAYVDANVLNLIDEDTLSTNSATRPPSQQSVKAYVDNEITAVSTTSIATGNSSATVTDSGSDGQFTVVADGNTELTITDSASTFSGTIETTSTSAGAIKTPTIQLDGSDNSITAIGTNKSIGLNPTGTGDVYATSDIIANGNHIATGSLKNPAITIGGLFNNQDAFIQGLRSNENITIDPAGTGTVELNANTNVTGTLQTTGVITAGGNIAMGGNQITGLDVTGYPSADSDAATKKYVDDSFASIGTSSISSGSTNATVDSSTFSVTASGNLEMTVTDAGMQLGGSGARVNSILDEDSFGSNSATALATQQSIKAFVVGELASIGTAATLSGSTNNTIATVTGANALAGEANLTFDGSTLAVTGAATVSTTLAVTGASTLDGVTITDNTISTNASNSNLEINANGSGTVVLENLSIAGDGATVTGILDEDAMGTNSAVKLATQQSIKAYVDAQDAAIASDTLTLTNKTFDVEATGNSISNIDVADLKSGVLDTDISSVSGSDDTLASAKAIKTYVDANAGSNAVTALNNATANELVTVGATTTELDAESGLTFDGSTLAVTGAATVSTTLGVTGASTLDGVTITDNTISTNASNADLEITANGTGRVDLSSNGTYLTSNEFFFNTWWGSQDRIKNFAANYVDTNVNSNTTGRTYNAAVAIANKLTTGSSSNGNWRPRALLTDATIDMNGVDFTVSGSSRGPIGSNSAANVFNSSSSSASTLESMNGSYASAAIADFNNPSQHMTVNNAIAVKGVVAVEGNGSSNKVITTGTAFMADVYVDEAGSGTSGVTNFTAFYTEGTGATNNFAFVSDAVTAVSKVGTLQQYRETINALTSSSTITVDCGLAPVHTVALGTNTEFNISNLGTGQSVTIIIKSSGTYTATFGTDGSTAVKFPGGAPTITDSGTDVVTIFNDGTDFLGNIAQAYA